jgi:hypothetical protein
VTRADPEDSNALGAGGDVALDADSLPVRAGLRLVVPGGLLPPRWEARGHAGPRVPVAAGQAQHPVQSALELANTDPRAGMVVLFGCQLAD